MTQPNRTKILIAERDCASLVSLMLWLDQFNDFEVAGATSESTSVLSKVQATRPDVLILGGAESLTEEIYLAKMINTLDNPPFIVVRSSKEPNALDTNNCIDAVVGPNTSIKDLCETVRRVTNKRRVAISAANMPATKAG